MKRTCISAFTAGIVVIVCSTVANAQLKWPVSVKFVYDANGMPPGDDLDCNDPTQGSAISCDDEVMEKIEYANQVLAKHGRGYAFDVIEILPWTNPPSLPNVRICVGGGNKGQMCILNAPEGCPSCTATSLSECCFANGTTGCDNQSCETTVCDADQYCCETEWDQLCVDRAADHCGSLCSICADGVWETPSDLSTIAGGPLHVILGCLARIDPDTDGDGLSEIYLWRKGALNTYIIDAEAGGVCGPRRCHSTNLSVTVIGQNKFGANVRPLHEFAHCLGLCHTHGCSWGNCCHDPNQTGSPVQSSTCGSTLLRLGQDCLSDTLPDHPNCEEVEEVVKENFEEGNLTQPTYDLLPCEERQLVINTMYNLVSYHMDDNDDRMCDGSLPLIQCNCDEPSPYSCPLSALEPTTKRCRHRFTSDQLDLMTDRSNAHAGDQLDTGCTRFVDADANPKHLVGIASCGDLSDEPTDGSSVHPYVTVTDGLQAADAGDIVLIRAGSYNEPMVIAQPVTLRASRGDAFIGRSGP